MATRARIGLLLGTEHVLSVYHHWDGYPSFLGVFLQQNYTTKEQIAELLDGGDISCIDSDTDWNNEKVDNHVQYYNDRGEKTEPRLDLSVEDYIENENSICEEYAYLFVNNEWKCYDLHTKLEVEIKERGLVNV
tara:strand:+ start:276 stop:677 length:402 start_codon:yes stop_codon:yes gene_type:complete